MLLGLGISLWTILFSMAKGWRAFAALAWFLGIMLLLAAWNGICKLYIYPFRQDLSANRNMPQALSCKVSTTVTFDLGNSGKMWNQRLAPVSGN